jgi:hypothetical protein
MQRRIAATECSHTNFPKQKEAAILSLHTIELLICVTLSVLSHGNSENLPMQDRRGSEGNFPGCGVSKIS